VLRTIAEGTAAATGDAFFRSLARHAAQALGARYAFVAETLSALESRSLAYWEGADFGEGFSYRFPGTPCQRVAAGYVCAITAGLQAGFPEDRWLTEIGAVSYVGVPLLNAAGKPIGHLAVLHTEPMEPADEDIAILKIFAARACAELERKQADEQLAKANEDVHRLNGEREALLEVNRAIGHHLNRDELFAALAGCLQKVVPTDRFGIELHVDGGKLQGHILSPQRAKAPPPQVTVLPADGTACDWVHRNREWYVVPSREVLRERFPVTFRVMEQEGMESLCALPLVTGLSSPGELFFMASAKNAYDHLSRSLMDQVASAVAVALDDCLAHEEVRRLRDQLAAENAYLQEEIRSEHNFDEIVGNSPALLAVLRNIDQVAPTDSTVLISGETGTGKELIARAIHDRSSRKGRPLVKVNCGAISAGLVESELFGHMKGSFTGALANRDGRFKVADGGTIFLDEVGELPLDTQVKLLRVLQEQEFEPIGSNKSVEVDVRIIAATNRDLRAAVAEGKFRSDLFYRLSVFPLQVPCLRDRAGDVPLLVAFFQQKLAKKFGKPERKVSDETMARLASYAWPGNIRELQNVIERAVVLSTGALLEIAPDFAPGQGSPDATSAADSLEEVERRHIEAVLRRANWTIEGERGAAKILNMNPSTLRSRMVNLDIKRPA
jgi:transcriptional regulator with GAF, ATPase, and Fis domain